MSNQNVYRYDSPVIYSSEELEIIKELVGFIRQYKGFYSGLSVLEAKNAISDYCRVANMKCTVDLFKQFPQMNKEVFSDLCGDVLPVLKDGASFYKRFTSETENVFRSIDITVV